LRMADWGVKDFPAAVREMRRRFPTSPLSGLGHSFGGQALGLSGVSDRFGRYMTLAAGSGYLGNMPDEKRLWFTMNVIGYPLAALLGYLPAWAGMGENIPFGAFNQWRRWCNTPEYFMSDPEVPETQRFADVTTTMVCVGFEDDPWATLDATRAMMEWYSHADVKLKWFTQEDAHGPVGHLGFFRPNHGETLWPQIVDWLTQS
jgi:predicted alpha/beta hydrolase